MPSLPELYYSAEILFKNWLCLTEFDWCGNEEAEALARALFFIGTFECQAERAGVVT
jgi:hypothetical protein